MRTGRPCKYNSDLERKTAKKELAKRRRLAKRKAAQLDRIGAGIRQYFSQKQRRKRNPTGLTNKQKRELAAALIQAAGAIVGNLRAQPSAGLDPGEAAKQLALWLKNLPGDYWDKRLGQRKTNFLRSYNPSWILESEKERPGVEVELDLSGL
jgi:hypothetical protein